jgi:hypothetical protein
MPKVLFMVAPGQPESRPMRQTGAAVQTVESADLPNTAVSN